MKLWTSQDLTRLPNIIQFGLIDEYHEGLQFHVDPDGVAEYALALQEDDPDEPAMAFLEMEVPDDQLDEWFSVCMEAHSAEHTNAEGEMGDTRADLEAMLEEDPNSSDLPGIRDRAVQAEEWFVLVDSVETGAQSIEILGTACINQPIPVTMLRLLNPETMMEVTMSKDIGRIAEAVETTESWGLESLGGAFWIYILFMIQNAFAIARGDINVEPLWKQQAAEDKADARRARRRQSYARRKRKGKRKRKQGASE